MPWITEDQAAAEVSNWKVEMKDLKPALITRQKLWEDYKKENSEWAASACEMGVSAATAALTGSGAFVAIEWMADVVTDAFKGAVVEKGLEKGIDRIAGTHLIDFEKGDSSFTLSADKKLATKIASGFLTVLVSAAGGTLTALTGGSAAIVAAIAIMVWIGDKQEAKRQKDWNAIVDSMKSKYDNIRQKRLQRENSKIRSKLERLVMSNALHDLEDQGLVKSYEWKVGNQSNIARYSTPNLKQLLDQMSKIDKEMGKDLWIIDLLEISRVFSSETRAFWDAIQLQQKNPTLKQPLGKYFDETKIKLFMQRQIQSHSVLDEVPATKAELILAKLREKVLSEYVGVDDEQHQALPVQQKVKTGTGGISF